MFRLTVTVIFSSDLSGFSRVVQGGGAHSAPLQLCLFVVNINVTFSSYPLSSVSKCAGHVPGHDVMHKVVMTALCLDSDDVGTFECTI